MTWCQLDTKPSANSVLPFLWLYGLMYLIIQHTYPITATRFIMFKRAREVGNPLFSLSLAGSFSHNHNAPCKEVVVLNHRRYSRLYNDLPPLAYFWRFHSDVKCSSSSFLGFLPRNYSRESMSIGEHFTKNLRHPTLGYLKWWLVIAQIEVIESLRNFALSHDSSAVVACAIFRCENIIRILNNEAYFHLKFQVRTLQ